MKKDNLINGLILFMIIFFPFSYSLKTLINWNLPWINLSGILAVVALILVTKKRTVNLITNSLWLLLFFIMCYLISTYKSVYTNEVNFYRYYREFIRLILCVSPFYLISIFSLNKDFNYNRYLNLFIFIGVIEVIFELYLVIFYLFDLYMPPNLFSYAKDYIGSSLPFIRINGRLIPRGRGSFGEGGVLGIFLFCTVFCNIYIIYRNNLEANKLKLYKVCLIFQLIGCFFAYSTSLWLALVVLFFVIFLGNISLNKINIFKLYTYFIIFLIFCIVIYIYLPEEVKKSLISVFYKIVDKSHGSNQERFFHVRHSFELFLQNPILGIGPGMYGLYTPNFPDTVTVQCFWLELLCETGILGFLSFVLFYIYLFVISFKFTKKLKFIFVGFLLGQAIIFFATSNWKWEFTFFSLAFIVIEKSRFKV